MNRERLLRVFLWWAVLASAIWVGGTLYQMVVVVPLWSSSPPESVRSFFGGTRYNETIWNFFGPPWMAARVVPILGALVTSWKWPPHRRLLLIVVACSVFVLVFTFAYVYPINSVLIAQAGGTASPDEIRSMVQRWILADRFRFGIGTLSFLVLLRAFGLPVDNDAR